jgi:hypothetical protein
MSMNHVLVRYKVRPDAVEENTAAVRAVYEELAEAQPDGFHYATFTAEDGVTFFHVASHAADRPNPLGAIAAFQRFSAGVGSRSEEPPVVSRLTEVGSYRWHSLEPAGSHDQRG